MRYSGRGLAAKSLVGPLMIETVGEGVDEWLDLVDEVWQVIGRNR